MGFLPGITSSGTRNTQEEYDSAGNYKEADLVRQDQNVLKIVKVVTIYGSASTNPISLKVNLLKNLNTKTSLK
jgi:hypothetical protein